MPTDVEKRRSGRPQENEPKFPLQKKKMDEALSFLKRLAWTSGRLSREVFGVNEKTFSSWATGQVRLSLMAKKAFHHDLGIKPEYWTNENLEIENAIDHTPERSQIAPSILPDLMRRLDKVAGEINDIRQIADEELRQPATTPAEETMGDGEKGKRQ